MTVRRQSTRVGVISFSGSGDNIVVTAVATTPVNVYGLSFTVSGATNIVFKDGTTALSGAFVMTANGSSMTFSITDEPWYATQPGNNFVINSSNAVTVAGSIWYTTG